MIDNADTLRSLWRCMVLIRTFEERVFRLKSAGMLASSAHLYSGQEAVAAGVCAHLDPADYLTSNHRGHGHALAKGIDPSRMMAELYGKATGTNAGKGGSMHIAQPSIGMLGASGIVGAGIPLTIGASMSAKLADKGQVAVTFFGEGAMGQGTVYECLNLAHIWRLPVVFVCENNGYAQSTPVEYALGTKDVADRARPFQVAVSAVDGQDVFTVYEAAGEAIQRARSGGGPSFIECKTYRYHGHYFGDDPLRYRTKEEETEARARDCLLRFESSVTDEGRLTKDELEAIRVETRARIDEAVRFAESSPEPDLSTLETDVYTTLATPAGVSDGR